MWLKKLLKAAAVGVVVFGLFGVALCTLALGFCFATSPCEVSIDRFSLVPFIALAGGFLGAAVCLIKDLVYPWMASE